jgi:hypothetical protein
VIVMKRLSRRSFLTLLAGAIGTGGLAGSLGVAFGRDRRRGQEIGTAALRHRHPHPSTTTTPTTSRTSAARSKHRAGARPLRPALPHGRRRRARLDGRDVVIRDTGSHAFVAHQVNGVWFRGCISHNTFEDAFWWDGAPDTRHPGPPSNDILYERCVASMVQYDPPFRGYTLTGFALGRGTGSVAKECVAVAVGVQGSQRLGLPVAGGLRGHLDHNRGAGISHGAYVNPYLYKDSTLFGNRGSAVELHANSDLNGATGLQL